jgi:AP2-like factor (euAP2 lineage)
VKRAHEATNRGALLTDEDTVAVAAASERQGPSKFVGVSREYRKWRAQISHDGKRQNLGCFDDEHEAARAVDTVARRLRGEHAHGGQTIGGGHTWRLNFPTEGEVKRAQDRGALLTKEDKAAAVVASERQGPSTFVGVSLSSWDKRRRKWTAALSHDRKRQHLGSFDDEHEAARAVDTAARRLRGDDAHGGRAAGGRKWLRLNFPTKREVARAKALGMPAAH